MTTPSARGAWAVWGLTLFGVVVYSVFGPLAHQAGVTDVVIQGLAVMAFATIGLLIVSRSGGNTIGWILSWFAIWGSIGGAAGVYAAYGLDVSALPGTIAAAWLARIAFAAAFIPLPLLFLLFPDGHVPSPRWRPVLWLLVGSGTVAILGWSLTPGPLAGGFAEFHHRPDNPLALPASMSGIVDGVTQVAGVVFVLGFLLSLLALVLRFRRSTGEERQQIRWVAYASAVFLGFAVAGILWSVLGGLLGANTDSSLISTVLFFGTILTLLFGVPIACALAILRYRLYDLDIVVRKTVIYATLVGLIVVLAGLALLVTGAFVVGPISNASIAIFGAGVVVGVLFIPLRRVATRVADRAVYGKRATPYEVLAQFSDRMADTYASDDVLSRMAQVLGSGTGASAARVWLRVGGELRPDAVWPPGAPATPPVATAADALPPLPDVGYAVEVRHQGELLGALSVAMPPDDPMTPSRERLVNDLASQAGLVLRNVRLIEELRSSRQRLVAAQDEERRKLERNIHDGAQQQLVALSVKLRLAEAMVGKDPDKERALLSDLQAATTDALEDLRDLARGIYPPLLADKGLAAALEAQARRSPVPVQIAPDGVGRFAPDVESAVYFCCLEALNNVAKYANASLVHIRLAAEDGALTFDVVDDGDGFDAATAAAGTGLQGMADRLDAIGGTLEIHSEPSRGTEVRGRVPAAPQP